MITKYLFLLFAHHQHHPIVLDGLKAVFVAEVIGFAGFGGECVREVGEVIAALLQFSFGQFGDAALRGVEFF